MWEGSITERKVEQYNICKEVRTSFNEKKGHKSDF